ncbi:MAG: 4-(cytidine 5'-diphospho)-2-C-methyl-D-erythritol kinase [Nocardioidaceae bacterium]
MTVVTVRSPAKINLELKVGYPPRDGYHPLATVYQAVSLYDEVKARPAGPGEVTVTITGEGEQVLPTDRANLAVQAAHLLAKEFDVAGGVALSIHKTIAVAGGLAGGSTDAAAALVACDSLWGLGATRQELIALAAQLGSDVPFCLVGGNAVGSGRGESVMPVLARGSYEWVLAYATSGLATADVYAEFDRVSDRSTGGATSSERDIPSDPEVSSELMTALRSGDPYGLGLAMHNDLQAPATRLLPGIRRTLDVGEEFGALGSLVSGSGPTCIFLAADDDHALDLAVALSASGTCRSVQRATGPVGGARLVT